MYQKNHVGSLKETVVLRFTNGYQITLEAGVEMSMSLTMVEAISPTPRAVDLPCCCAEIESAGVVNPDCPRHGLMRANH